MTVNLLLDVFSLLDAQRPVLLDQRWGFQEADNASPTPVNRATASGAANAADDRSGWGCG